MRFVTLKCVEIENMCHFLALLHASETDMLLQHQRYSFSRMYGVISGCNNMVIGD